MSVLRNVKSDPVDLFAGSGKKCVAGTAFIVRVKPIVTYHAHRSGDSHVRRLKLETRFTGYVTKERINDI